MGDHTYQCTTVVETDVYVQDPETGKEYTPEEAFSQGLITEEQFNDLKSSCKRQFEEVSSETPGQLRSESPITKKRKDESDESINGQSDMSIYNAAQSPTKEKSPSKEQSPSKVKLSSKETSPVKESSKEKRSPSKEISPTSIKSSTDEISSPENTAPTKEEAPKKKESSEKEESSLKNQSPTKEKSPTKEM